jgi:ATP-dependent Lon protease
MTEPETHLFSQDDFSGTVRVFPLPNLVVFPHILQALHVFEPRYRELLEDSLQGDRLIAMGVLAPGWQEKYNQRPAIRDVVCLGRVISHTKMQADKYNILLLGLRRARVIYELPPRRLFREAKVELLDDVYPAEGDACRPQLRRRLLDRFRRIVPRDPAAQGQVEQLLGSQIPLGVLTDLVAYSLQISQEEKRRMLDQVNVDARARTLLQHLDQVFDEPSQASLVQFPPEFSTN